MQPHEPAIEDSTGITFTYHKLLLSSLALANGPGKISPSKLAVASIR
jgi:hypothetical protein